MVLRPSIPEPDAPSKARDTKTNFSGFTISRNTPVIQWLGNSGESMQMRMAPPGLTSTSQTGLVKPCGPHQRISCCGSVHALKTSSRGASTMRVSTRLRFSTADSILLAMILIFKLKLSLDIGLEFVEGLVAAFNGFDLPVELSQNFFRLENRAHR